MIKEIEVELKTLLWSADIPQLTMFVESESLGFQNSLKKELKSKSYNCKVIEFEQIHRILLFSAKHYHTYLSDCTNIDSITIFNKWLAYLFPERQLQLLVKEGKAFFTQVMPCERHKINHDYLLTLKDAYILTGLLRMVEFLNLNHYKPSSILLDKPTVFLPEAAQSNYANIIRDILDLGHQVLLFVESSHLFDSIRVAIKNNRIDFNIVTAFYYDSFLGLNTEIEFDRNGRMSEVPDGMFDEFSLNARALL